MLEYRRGQISIPLPVFVTVVLALILTCGSFFVVTADQGAAIEKNNARIEHNEKSLDRILDKLDVIEDLLRERK